MFHVYVERHKKKYYLHKATVQLRSGKSNVIYYFSTNSNGAIDGIPDGFELFLGSKSGLPLLKKIR